MKKVNFPFDDHQADYNMCNPWKVNFYHPARDISSYDIFKVLVKLTKAVYNFCASFIARQCNKS